MIEPTPPNAPHQPGDRVKVLHNAGAAGTCLSVVKVLGCMQNPRSGRWQVTVEAPVGLPTSHLDPQLDADTSPPTYSTIPDYVTAEKDWLVPVPA